MTPESSKDQFEDFDFIEEVRPPLTDRDRDLFLSLLENPSSANEALRRLLSDPIIKSFEEGNQEAPA